MGLLSQLVQEKVFPGIFKLELRKGGAFPTLVVQVGGCEFYVAIGHGLGL